MELPALPTAANAPVFQPEGGHYAELLLRDGQWHGYVDGKPAADHEDVDQMYDFPDNSRDRVERDGWPPLVLISADGRVPMSEIKMAIRTVPVSGIDQCHLLLRSSSGGKQESSSYHSLVVEFSYPHWNRNEMIEPLFIAINGNGSIQQEVDDSLTLLDASQASSDLPGLDSKLRHYTELARDENAAPVIRVLVNGTTPYQGYIDVLSRLHAHGLEPDYE